MLYSKTLLGLVALSATSATAQGGLEAFVTVGAGGKLEFSPNNITLTVGSQIKFTFNPQNHSVTQSSFDDPCHPLAGGFFSGFVPTNGSPSATTFTITVNDSTPIWFYCSQPNGNHCQAGMVGSINALSTGPENLNAFILLAKNATTSTSPPTGPVGGFLNTNSNSNPSTSSTTSITSTTTSAVATQTKPNAASELSAQLFAVAAVGLGALAML